jgi:hypothetical protein
LEASHSPLSSRAAEGSAVLQASPGNVFSEEAVWASRPVGPTAKRQPSPGRAGASIPQRCPSAVGAAHFTSTCISTLSRNTSRTSLRNRRSLGCARDDKGEGIASVCIRWLVERTAGPHSTSLRAGSPPRFAPVGMTIHIWVRDAGAQEKLSSRQKSHRLRAYREICSSAGSSWRCFLIVAWPAAGLLDG